MWITTRRFWIYLSWSRCAIQRRRDGRQIWTI
jgi:hypothetical protein